MIPTSHYDSFVLDTRDLRDKTPEVLVEGIAADCFDIVEHLMVYYDLDLTKEQVASIAASLADVADSMIQP